MRAFNAEELESWSGGKWMNGHPDWSAKGFCYDTRKLNTGDLFVAIKTASRDGHDFLDEAKQKGAVGALVQDYRESSSLPQLQADDSLKGFRSIAAAYRKEWKAEVIGVTGSCGKTTVKDLLIQLLGGPPVAQGTQGNLNNLIGVPTTMMGVDSSGCEFAVVEAGISEPGEMPELARTIDPDIVVFTAIGPAHLEQLENVDTVAIEKGQLASGEKTRRAYLGETCTPFAESLFSGERIFVEEMSDEKKPWSYRRVEDSAGMKLELVGPEGTEIYRIEGTGKALASNAALAIAVARDFEISVDQVANRLSSWKPSGMRGEWHSYGEANVYVDCYNANPLSMLDALETFNAKSGSDRARLYVIGGMEELGEQSKQWHENLGASLSIRSEDSVYLVGDDAKSVLEGMESSGNEIVNTKVIPDIGVLRDVLLNYEGDVFLKGSRRYRLEEALTFLSITPCSEGASC